MTIYLEVFIRFGSIGLLTGLCALMLRTRLKTPLLRYAFLLNLAMICLLLTAGTRPWVLSGPEWVVINVFATALFAFGWLFGLALFEEDFRIGAVRGGILAVYFGLIGFYAAWYLGFRPPWMGGARLVWLAMSLGFMVHIVYRALSGRSQDLVEARRRERVRIAVGIGVMFIFIYLATEAFQVFAITSGPRYLMLLAPPFSLMLLLWLARMHPEALAFEAIRQAPPEMTGLDPRDVPTKAKLDTLMDTDCIYREHGLTIRKLAEHVGVPEHQLRSLINRSMGFRNFSSFLNHYRIGEAKHRLEDPEQARIPVLTIAMDVGYASLTPFNSAFKSIVGMTPSAFRAEALRGPSQT
ncbi:MAG: AraC family transcriptional regulator [Pseudomonadota bacterium]